MKKNCQGLAGLLFGHRYEAAYDESRTFPAGHVPPGNLKMGEMSGVTPDEFIRIINSPIEAHKETRKVYRGHVCRRCGDVANRQER